MSTVVKRRIGRMPRSSAGSSHHQPDHHPSPKSADKTERELRIAEGRNWPVAIWLVVLHLGALTAPFFFTWQAVVLTVFLHWFTGGIGICLGYHRLLTHSSFKTWPPVRWMLATIGCLAGEGPPINWVADHRQHHAHSDQDLDPHTPQQGKWWSHAGWLAWALHGPSRQAQLQHWAPDLTKEPVMRALDWLFIPVSVLFGLAIGAAGWALGGWEMAASFVAWGMFARLVFVLHATWMVNSASHLWGYRNYETTDNSRNNWFVALVTYGEGWHNNHHAYPRMANHGHRWWEFDMTFWAIRALQATGLAWDVVDYKRRNEVS